MRMLSGARLRLSVRILVLGAFAVCCVLGRLGLWAVAFISGLIVETIMPRRLYCMWLCPVRAAAGLSGTLPAVKKEKVAAPPGTKAIKASGRIFTAVFLVLFSISIALGLRGWLFPALVVLGIISSSLLSLQSFCSKLCPMGAAFFIVRRFSGTVTGIIQGIRAASLKRSSEEPGTHPEVVEAVSSGIDGDYTTLD